jgi:shikimate kinase
MTRPDRILLIGMMGSGKTAIGVALREVLGWRYYDNDAVLEELTGSDARTLLENDGEAALRRAESATLTYLLTEGGPLVGSVAAGVVLDPLDRARLRAGGYVVWLRANVDTLAERVAGSDRPWIEDDPRGEVTQMYARRAALYESVAAQTIDVDHLPVPEVAARIVFEWGRR